LTQSTGNAFNDFHCVARVWALSQFFSRRTLYFTSMSDANDTVKYDPRCFLLAHRDWSRTNADLVPFFIQRAWLSPIGVFVFGHIAQKRSTCFFISQGSPQINLLAAFLKRMSSFDAVSGLSWGDYIRRLHVLR
jgi:hypothetical protein